jgi:tetratricopeptide (TPR) repeat protein
VALDDEGARLVSGSADRTVRVWDARTGRLLATLRGHTDRVTSVAFVPHTRGARVVSAGGDRTVRLWDVDSGQELLALTGHREAVLGLGFSADGGWLATGSGDRTVRLWDGRYEQPARTLSGHAGEVAVVVASADGRLLASGGADQSVRVWDLRSGQQVHSLAGHTRSVRALAFSADGSRLVSGGYDRTVKVWDVRSGRELLSLTGLNGSVVAVAFSTDGESVAARDETGEVRAWSADDGHPLDDGGGPIPASVRQVFSTDGARRIEADGLVVRVVAVDADRRERERQQEVLTRQDAVDLARRRALAKAAEDEGRHEGALHHLEALLREQPWDAQLHLRRAHALAHLGRGDEAAVALMRASFLQPGISPWPLDPTAARRGDEAAQAFDYARAIAAYELAVHQPNASPTLWGSLLLAQTAAGQTAAAARTLNKIADLLPTLTNDTDGWTLLYRSQAVPCDPQTAARLVEWTSTHLGRKPTTVQLHRHAVVLYRAERYDEAAGFLARSVKEHGSGGYVDTLLFQALSFQKQGEHEKARQSFSRYENWYRTQTFSVWQDRMQWALLWREGQEATFRRMPRVEDDD